MLRLAVMLCIVTVPVNAESVVATRVIRAQSVLVASDVAVVEADIPGAMADVLAVVGQEARVTLYPGRAIRAGDIGPPALIDRNQIVALRYAAGTLAIATDGRALARGGIGDAIRVMNLSSRSVVMGRVTADGGVNVGPNP
ncbi:flagellar basal body P-ring formation chaperone FlgA [Pseudorhodobacter sp.]|uniref:flagellar basal body P-ring formation chaperone FlgA n=1 Tax=Pseudorhodobacter sp. TaxID=1934400 RepID=UPI002649E09B|nr:flagellar basal body P-ring formation chaperone FlgA [Pseudorhodobacter sp.]MDN5788063.1 flagellar basal body P-ring formation protein FlgA [Pseudorhodobacter sp.]